MSDPAPWEEYECEACDIKQTQKTIEDVDNEEAQEIDYCEQCDFKCLECPCRWKLVEDSLVETAIQEFGAAIHYPDGRNPNASVSPPPPTHQLTNCSKINKIRWLSMLLE